MDIGNLKKLALRASRGPWKTKTEHNPHNQTVSVYIEDKRKTRVAKVWSQFEFPERSVANAAFLAAVSPDVILGLLDMLERMQCNFAEFANNDLDKIKNSEARAHALLEAPDMSERWMHGDNADEQMDDTISVLHAEELTSRWVNGRVRLAGDEGMQKAWYDALHLGGPSIDLRSFVYEGIKAGRVWEIPQQPAQPLEVKR